MLFPTRSLSLLLAIILIASMALAQSPDFSTIDNLMDEAVAKGNIPGGVVLIGHDGKVFYHKAFGYRSLEPARERMTEDTIFDMASLTKCMVTATSVMKLVEQGKIRLSDPAARYVPEFGRNGKGDITVRELLTHYSGLPEDLDLKSAWAGRNTAFQMIVDTKPIFPPGSRFLYSDINFEMLGFIVEKVSGMPLNEYAERNIFTPLGMKETKFEPPANWFSRIAPTEYDERGRMLRGVVHDPTARRMGGVAGHAGLFSTADDTAKFAQDMLTGFKALSQLAVEKMTTPQQPPNATAVRGLGWDIDSPFSTNRGELLPVGSFGHTGFTGTSLWIDPATNTYIIILTNVVHPRAGKSVVALRSKIATAATAALDLSVTDNQQLRLASITGYNELATASRRVAFRNGDVKLGIDVLEQRKFDVLRGTSGKRTRVGLVTNHTGLDSRGRRTIDVLARVPGVELAAIFSPEHGVAGALDTTEIGNGKDEATGVTIYSVYGNTDAKRRPALDVVRGLDVLVYDIQDIGARFYTYETTLGYFLEAAAKADKRMVVLDRPNPITGAFVQGPVADPGRETFVTYGQVPIRHGMTIGELAKMYNAERGINARLTIVPVQGWMRGDWFDSTGAVWINPSPNMRSLTEATLYPGIGLIEGTNISVGRGTNTPFELVGAPWINADEFAKYMNARLISGVRFVPVNFKPTADVYANQSCGGVNIIVVDRSSLDSPELGVEIASALHKLYPEQYKLDKLDWLLVNKAAAQAIAAGEDPRRIADDWREGLQKFLGVRKKYLIY